MHLLADVVSKNGNLLLNVGPHADGRIPDAARDTLLAVGAWLKTNGEAIYGTRPWTVFGEGPTETANGTFAESKAKPYTARDFRFTTEAGTALRHPAGGAGRRPRAYHRDPPGHAPVKRVSLLGTDAPVRFEQTRRGPGADPARERAAPAGQRLSHRNLSASRLRECPPISGEVTGEVSFGIGRWVGGCVFLSG